jgi:hypothetical protein
MKKSILFLYALFLLAFQLPAQLPDSEVWLFTYDFFSGKFTFTGGQNVSNQKGYDNQPAFSENGSYMVWSSQRDSNQTDIYRFDVMHNTITRMTQTPYSEYSPTYMPGNKFISSVVVEKDSVQRLWQYHRLTGKAELALPKVYQVGYHCWFDARTVFLFQVTEPSTLVIADARNGITRSCVSNVGRCMQIYRSQKMKMLLYTQEADSSKRYIKALDGKGNKLTDFKPIPCLEGSEDFVVDRVGNILMAKGSKVYIWRIDSSTAWEEVGDFATYGITKITRLSLSPDGRHLAVVDNPK